MLLSENQIQKELKIYLKDSLFIYDFYWKYYIKDYYMFLEPSNKYNPCITIYILNYQDNILYQFKGKELNIQIHKSTEIIMCTKYDSCFISTGCYTLMPHHYTTYHYNLKQKTYKLFKFCINKIILEKEKEEEMKCEGCFD